MNDYETPEVIASYDAEALIGQALAGGSVYPGPPFTIK